MTVWFGTAANPYKKKARRLTQALLGVPSAANDGFGALDGREHDGPALEDTFDALPAVSTRSPVGTIADLEGFLAQKGFFREVIDLLVRMGI